MVGLRGCNAGLIIRGKTKDFSLNMFRIVVGMILDGYTRSGSDLER